MAAAAGGHQYRGQKSPHDTAYGKVFGLLKYGQEAGKDHQGEHDHKRQAVGQQMVKPRGRIDGEIKHAHPASLEEQPVYRPTFPQTPAGGEQGQTACKHADQTELNGHQVALGRVFEQKGHAEEEHDNADFGNHIAGGKKGFHVGLDVGKKRCLGFRFVRQGLLGGRLTPGI